MRARAASRTSRLGVAVVDAQREQLEQLAGEVLVGRVLVGVGEAQEELHRPVARDRPGEVAEAPERAAPQGPVLGQHQPRVAHLGVRGGEVVVPVEGHPLDQRVPGAHRAVEPPEHVVAVGVDRVERPALHPRRPPRRIAPRGPQQVADRALQAHRRHPVDLARQPAEARAPQQPLDPRALARPPRHRPPRRARGRTTMVAVMPRASWSATVQRSVYRPRGRRTRSSPTPSGRHDAGLGAGGPAGPDDAQVVLVLADVPAAAAARARPGSDGRLSVNRNSSSGGQHPGRRRRRRRGLVGQERARGASDATSLARAGGSAGRIGVVRDL